MPLSEANPGLRTGTFDERTDALRPLYGLRVEPDKRLPSRLPGPSDERRQPSAQVLPPIRVPS